MQVSVVLCTYSPGMYEHFEEAADSVLAQTYEEVELVVIVDGNDELCGMVQANYGDVEDVVVHCNDQNRGLSYGRNKGSELSSGDVVAFMDDDAIAAKDWIEELIAAYERHEALAVGGCMKPEWVVRKPAFVPEEFYFLFGVTYRGFPTEETQVRNTFSSNLSFRRDVFLDLGGFKQHMGKRGSNDLQGGETELCSRLRDEYGREVVYNPEAVVSHKVFDYRTEFGWLVKRAFWQGYSKRLMESETPGAIDREWGFLGQLLRNFIPNRVRRLTREPSVEKMYQLLTLLVFLATVGIGYGYGVVKSFR